MEAKKATGWAGMKGSRGREHRIVGQACSKAKLRLGLGSFRLAHRSRARSPATQRWESKPTPFRTRLRKGYSYATPSWSISPQPKSHHAQVRPRAFDNRPPVCVTSPARQCRCFAALGGGIGRPVFGDRIGRPLSHSAMGGGSTGLSVTGVSHDPHGDHSSLHPNVRFPTLNRHGD
jgi:hypothetical protein